MIEDDLDLLDNLNDGTDICFMKLISGEMLVAEINAELEFYDQLAMVVLQFPAMVVKEMNSDDTPFYFLQPWLPNFIKTEIFPIKTNHILHIERADDTMLEAYAKYLVILKGVEEEDENVEEQDEKKILH